MSDPVLVRHEGAVAVVSFNRPQRHNAFNDAQDDAFFEALASLSGRSDLRCLVIRGEGASFSSGRDTAELGRRSKGESDYEFIAAGHARTRLLLTMPVPVIASLKGWVLGGSFERALLCDMRIASSDARMALPEVAHGVIPDSGGAARLFQMAGHGVASDLALTGRVIGAEEARMHGIVSRVVEPDALDDEVMELAQLVASRSPTAVRMALGIVRSLGGAQVEASMHEELMAQSLVFGSEDYAELKAARAQNRDPKFTGR